MSLRVRWRMWLLRSGRKPRTVRRLLYHGHSVTCPCCGWAARRYMAHYNRRDAVCGGCLSQERHRALRVFLDGWLAQPERPLRVLHFAPERTLRRWLEGRQDVDYLTADLDRAGVDAHMDMEELPLRSESVDLVIASHVLEHVADDGAAVKEIRRVLRPGASALLMVPVDSSRDATYEDPHIATPEQRAAAYWQADHVRLYGRDLQTRLARSGLEVSMVQPSRQLSGALVRRYGLLVEPAVLERWPIAPPDEIYVATR
jgi:SAM-dependent methyltransferase